MKLKAMGFTAVALCLLTGCSSSTVPLRASPPANMVAPCALPKPLKQPADMGTMLKFTTDALALNRECAAKHKALTDWVKAK